MLLLDDPLRPESGRVVRLLRDAGVILVAMLTGDDHAVAEVVSSALGLDIVITVDRLDRLTEGMAIAGWSRHIAAQSVVVGMGCRWWRWASAPRGPSRRWSAPSCRSHRRGGHRQRVAGRCVSPRRPGDGGGSPLQRALPQGAPRVARRRR
jgi:hypothetical protein